MQINQIIKTIEKQLLLLKEEVEKIKQGRFISCLQIEERIKVIEDQLEAIKWEIQEK
ncbi:MAG: hypothetical protein AB1397_07750 [bacterium]